MAAAAVPALLKVGSMVGGSLLAKKLNGPTGQEKTAMTGAQGTAQMLGAAAPQLVGQGTAAVKQGTDYTTTAGNYYQKLLGSRAGLREATAPDTAAALDYYKGAAGKINNTMTGGSRDYANAELERDKVGKLALMPAMARSEAGKNLVGTAAPLLSTGTSMTGQGIYAGQAAGGAQNSLYNMGADQGAQQKGAGSKYGSMIFDLLSGMKFGKGKSSAGGGVPSMPWTLPAGGGF